MTFEMPTVLMIGGGQLSRMTHQAAIALGIDFRVLANNLGESAAQVVQQVSLGSHDDELAIRAAALDADVITFDHEHVPLGLLEDLQKEGYSIQPSPQALRFAQNKLLMRQRLSELGAPMPAWKQIQTPADAADFGLEHGWPVVLKVARGGYDGRGVWICNSVDEIADAMDLLPNSEWLLEQKMQFSRELSAQVARSTTGETTTYPVVETRQWQGMCSEVIAPAPGATQEMVDLAQSLAIRIATELDVTGMLAVELFEVAGTVYVNELAMRPHNSGHWTIDGAVTSQFENHLRAVLGWPLGESTPTAPVVVMANLIGAENELSEFGVSTALIDSEIKLHLYGKEARPKRKIGHLNLAGIEVEQTLQRVKTAAAEIVGMEH